MRAAIQQGPLLQLRAALPRREPRPLQGTRPVDAQERGHQRDREIRQLRPRHGRADAPTPTPTLTLTLAPTLTPTATLTLNPNPDPHPDPNPHPHPHPNPTPHQVEALLDQRKAGKQLALITNSDWVYTSTLMQAAYEPRPTLTLTRSLDP